MISSLRSCFGILPQRLIRKYANVTLPVTELLRTMTEKAHTPQATGRALTNSDKPLPNGNGL